MRWSRKIKSSTKETTVPTPHNRHQQNNYFNYAIDSPWMDFTGERGTPRAGKHCRPRAHFQLSRSAHQVLVTTSVPKWPPSGGSEKRPRFSRAVWAPSVGAPTTLHFLGRILTPKPVTRIHSPGCPPHVLQHPASFV